MNPKDLVGSKKAPLRFVPAALMIGAAEAMAVGAAKYGPYNWREQPVSAVTYIEAILRHLFAWQDGQDVAEDTGISHLGHAAAGIGILLDATANGSLLDDRPTPGPAADMLRLMDKSVGALVNASCACGADNCDRIDDVDDPWAEDSNGNVLFHGQPRAKWDDYGLEHA